MTGTDQEPVARTDRRGAHVVVRGISKRFGGIQALREVDLEIEPGCVHGLIGENGAGKSTLGKILAGVHRPDSGALIVDGRPVHYRSPHEALNNGLTLIAQELVLEPQRSVMENVLLGVESRRGGFLRHAAMRRRYGQIDEQTGYGLPADAPVGSLRLADQQKVEILRAVARDARLVVMDEPTATLTPDESERLRRIARNLAEEGRTVVFVSHFLEEVLAVCDVVTVLRDGEVVHTRPASEETPESLVTAMVGRSLDLTFPPKRPPASESPVVLEARALKAPGRLRHIDLAVRAGEIVGLAGLVGSGRSEVARAIFGADACSGTIAIEGLEVKLRSPRDAVRAGIAMLPESRKEEGLVMGRSITENVTLPHLDALAAGGFVKRREEARRIDGVLSRVDVRGAQGSAPVADLSGGNQQKVLFAKWLLRRPKILIADEPTRGVDVGAKRAIYELILTLADEGMAVLLISSELEEVLGLSHRVLVMRDGGIVGELAGDDATEAAVLNVAFGTEIPIDHSRR
jgi:ABC-type sugar transport system ATPase subunit